MYTMRAAVWSGANPIAVTNVPILDAVGTGQTTLEVVGTKDMDR